MAKKATETKEIEVKKDPFEKIEKMIFKNNPREIRLVPLNKKPATKGTLQEFLQRFFTEWNAEKDTIYADDREIQTAARRRRSLGDIYQICKYYYPESTLNQVLNLLYNILPKSIPKGFRTSFCFTIHKRVWYFDARSSTARHNDERVDEFGHAVQYYLRKIEK